MHEAIERLKIGVFQPRWEELSAEEQNYVYHAATLMEERRTISISTTDITRSLKMNAQQLSTTWQRILTKGIMVKNRNNTISPLMPALILWIIQQF